MQSTHLTGTERFFKESDLIVSKTNLKGHITYANDIFIDLSGYVEKDLINAPHSILRHPEMPRCVFKLLWDRISVDKKEIFAYVINRCANGDHYWVFAHVTPTFDDSGQVLGFHSNRRVPSRDVLNNTIIPLYKTLLDEEARHANRKDGMNSAYKMLHEILADKGVSYDEFIFSL